MILWDSSWAHPGKPKMQDKMAAPNKVTDTRTELAELIKKRAEIAVSCRQTVNLFLMINSCASLLSFCAFFALIYKKDARSIHPWRQSDWAPKIYTRLLDVFESDKHFHNDETIILWIWLFFNTFSILCASITALAVVEICIFDHSEGFSLAWFL